MMSWEISEETLRAYCAGLFHDLGKVWAQVPGRGTEPSRFDCETPERHQVRWDDCDSCKRRYRYAHAAMSGTLAKETLPEFRGLADAAALHHAPNAGELGDLVRWVVLGDHLSAGERDERYDRVGHDGGRPAPALLHPLAKKRDEVFIRPGLLDSRLLFGQLRAGDADSARAAFGEVFDGLRSGLEAAAALSGGDWLALSEHLTGAVYRGAMGVPSAFMTAVADIPLATHLHLAGAFAAALAADGSRAEDSAGARIGLVAGDASGIQEFIHDTGSRRAARALRARSFYIQLLSLVAARWVAIRCGVPPWCAFSVVGGQFVVAVPAGRVGMVGDLQEELDRVLVAAHGPGLSLNLAGLVCSGEELRAFHEVYRQLREALSVRKSRKFEALARSGELFRPQAVASMGRACRTCGREAIGGRVEDDDGVERRVCEFCASLEDLGRALLDSKFVLLEPAGPGERLSGWRKVMAELGHRVELTDRPPERVVRGAVIALDSEGLKKLPCARLVATGRYAPRSRDGLLDFEEIAEQGEGRKLIATMKADVDDLGVFLQRYFTERPPSPSRFLAVSTALSLFFEAYLPELAEERFRNIYLVFSGGDDVALAGPLFDVLDFASELRKEFARWTAGNDDLHFSAGVVAAHAHRPVQAGIEAAEEALRVAKGQRPNGAEAKNALVALDVWLKWPGFETVRAYEQKLVELVRGQDGRKQLARRALQHLQLLEKAAPDRYEPLIWRSYYQLNRVARDHRDAEQVLMDLRKEAFQPAAGGEPGGRRVALAARLAELRTASDGDTEQRRRTGGA
jgi:CRISPR-associated protein Csm1